MKTPKNISSSISSVHYQSNRLSVAAMLLYSSLMIALFSLRTANAIPSNIAASSSESHHYNNNNNNNMLTRLEASIMGESALIDKESGRIFWEGGSSSTVSASISPRLQQHMMGGLVHIKASILTVLLLVTVYSLISSIMKHGWMKVLLSKSQQLPDATTTATATLGVKSINWWFVLTTIILYFLEAYTCSTRLYLANSIRSPDGVEEYIEKLRAEQPVVEWKVRCFHYETPSWLSPIKTIKTMMQRKKTSGGGSSIYSGNTPQGPELDVDDSGSTLTASSSSSSLSLFSLLQFKRITSTATGTYTYQHCVDKTIAGVWKRARAAAASISGPAPFTKITLSKILVLANSKARDDYFKQQAQFVVQHGQGDDHAEFATNIGVQGFQPRMLAVRHNVPTARYFNQGLFWLFTALGLTVPYRIWFSNHCDELRVTVVKETLAEAPPPMDTSAASTSSTSRSWFGNNNNNNNNKKQKRGDDNNKNNNNTGVTSTTTTDDELFRPLMQKLQLYRQEQGIVNDDDVATTTLEQSSSSPEAVPNNDATTSSINNVSFAAAEEEEKDPAPQDSS